MHDPRLGQGAPTEPGASPPLQVPAGPGALRPGPRRLWLLGACVAALGACPHPTPDLVDPSLPEQLEPVEAKTPEAVLEDAAGQLDPSARAKALALLIEQLGPAWDARGLGDPSPWVQRAAVSALIARGDAPAQEALARFVGDPSRDRIVRSLAAVWLPGEPAAAAIGGAWREAVQPWDRAPLALAALVNGDQEARAGLDAALQTGELPLDVELILEIGHTGDTELLPALAIAQTQVEPELRLAIAAARLLLGDATAEQPFRKALAAPNVEARLEALDTLSDVDRPATVSLLSRARAEGPELVTWYAELSLAARSGTDPDLFLRAARDADREVRQLAVRASRAAAVGGTANKKVAKAAHRVVLERLADPDLSVRLEAVAAARQLSLAEAEPLVSRLLSDGSQMLRIEAAGTLLALR